MDSKQFILIISKTYNEPLIVDGVENLKLKYIKKYIEDTFKDNDLTVIAEKIIKNYKPTGINPCPLIPHIAEIIGVNDSLEDKARSVSAEIINAISRFGYCNGKEAQKSLSTIAWKVVEAEGGWEQVCEMVTTSKISIFQAQFRDLALSISKQSKTNEILTAISGVVLKEVDYVK